VLIEDGQTRGVLGAHTLGVTSHIAAKRGLHVQDLLGLADPVTAHYELVGGRGRPGHEKWLPDAWIIARYGDVSDLPAGVSQSDVALARQALRCGALAELQASYQKPLTWQRFGKNLVGSPKRTVFRYSPDPEKAVEDQCQGGQ
jgi:arabinofuranosyltransferase